MNDASPAWLRSALHRAQTRLEYCRRELNRFLDRWDPFDYADARTNLKLEEDVRRALLHRHGDRVLGPTVTKAVATTEAHKCERGDYGCEELAISAA